uniref:Copine domain-containing protein n=1 Tax=Heterorhabditis bacteriophora TaxID=37862 RepID=A0A1I7XNZ8_HETBA
MADWVEDLLQLYEENRIRPLALIFSGGNFTKGNQPAGVDMRCFSESEFVAFIRMFYPHLQEVQLSTTRTRESSVLNNCEIVVDVGGVYDHLKGRYDHHQKFVFLYCYNV